MQELKRRFWKKQKDMKQPKLRAHSGRRSWVALNGPQHLLLLIMLDL